MHRLILGREVIDAMTDDELSSALLLMMMSAFMIDRVYRSVFIGQWTVIINRLMGSIGLIVRIHMYCIWRFFAEGFVLCRGTQQHGLFLVGHVAPKIFGRGGGGCEHASY